MLRAVPGLIIIKLFALQFHCENYLGDQSRSVHLAPLPSSNFIHS